MAITGGVEGCWLEHDLMDDQCNDIKYHNIIGESENLFEFIEWTDSDHQNRIVGVMILFNESDKNQNSIMNSRWKVMYERILLFIFILTERYLHVCYFP